MSLNVVAIAAAYLIFLASALCLELGAAVILVVFHAPLDVLVEAHILLIRVFLFRHAKVYLAVMAVAECLFVA